ncbi:MAG: choice-of-anchor tandem repeat GloVer-containing protein [Candidatus Sulfotelmatobacter sp.]
MDCIRRQVHTLRMAAFALSMLALLFMVAGSAVPAQAQIPTPTALYDFGPNPDVCQGAYDTHLWGPLVQGRDGNLYGASNDCGVNGSGGVYKITPEGAESVLVAFPANFDQCIGGLTLASDGNFYGSCLLGNPATGLGSLYRVTPAGEFTDLYDFTNAYGDQGPYFAPIQATDGNLYGTTSGNGVAGGNVYKYTLAGEYTNLHTFSAGDATPFGTLLQASNGDFYGTVVDCALTGNRGCVYKISTKGVYDEFYGFVDATGSSPYSGLIQGTNGKLYGSTDGGGTNDSGVIYSLTTAGKITVLHNIDSTTDGYQPSIIQATDGNFYGGGWGGGTGNQGSLYELTSKNVFSVILLPNPGPIGIEPLTPLIQHTNGLLYGTTSSGADDWGAFFSLNIGAKPFINLASLSGKQGATVAVFGQGFASSSVVKFGGVAAESVTLTGSTYLTATVPAGALTGTVTVTEGATTLTSRQTYKVLPTVLSFTPPSGPVGTPVTITGTALTQTTEVKFDGKAATFTVNSDTEITATVPSAALTGTISVITKGGSASSKTKFTVN